MGAIYLDVRPRSFSAHAQMSSMAFREHASDAHVPLNGGELAKPQISTWREEAGLQCFFLFFFYGFWSARKHTVPVLSNALSSFLPSPCLAELPWPWVSCACLCGLWETESKKRAKGLSPDWISYYDVAQETRFFSHLYELCIFAGGLARLTAALSHSHSLYFPRPIHVFRSHLFLSLWGMYL